MSREIKFRAWDKANECWLNFGYANIYRKEDGEPDTIFKFDFSDNYIVEQYTSLIDKNGKEIYEGDIVKQLMYVFEGKEHITTWVVRWNKENCCFELHYLSGNLFGDSMMADDEEYKVIGNIHENPELLGGEE